MSKKSFNKKFPTFKWIFVFAIALSIPITLFSLNTKTQTRSNATGDTISCSYAPIWSSLLGHIDGSNYVRYKFSLNLQDSKPDCGVAVFLWATVPTGWQYKYEIPDCTSNRKCYVYLPDNPLPFYVKITRPSTARKGSYTIKLNASQPGSPTSVKSVSYIVE